MIINRQLPNSDLKFILIKNNYGRIVQNILKKLYLNSKKIINENIIIIGGSNYYLPH